MASRATCLTVLRGLLAITDSLVWPAAHREVEILISYASCIS